MPRPSQSAVVMGSVTYGTKTEAVSGTYEELAMILSERKPIFHVKMCTEFADAFTRMQLNTSRVNYAEWPGTPASSAAGPYVPAMEEDGTLRPEDLEAVVDKVVARLREETTA